MVRQNRQSALEMAAGQTEKPLVSKPHSSSAVAAAKAVLDRNTRDVGFVTRAAFAKSAQEGELIVARVKRRVVGFARFHLRLDNTLTVYEIAVNAEHRTQGLGSAMITKIVAYGRARGATLIQLKCPVASLANGFYRRIGFHPREVVSGRRRNLVVWTSVIGSKQRDA